MRRGGHRVDAGRRRRRGGYGRRWRRYFNISTLTPCSWLGWRRVAKHGQPRITSQCGAADFLEAMGSPSTCRRRRVRCSTKTGFGFMFAPNYHPAMRHAS